MRVDLVRPRLLPPTAGGAKPSHSLGSEAFDRDAAAAGDAAQRMIAERLGDLEQWKDYQ